MKIVMMRPDELKPYERNPRINDKAVDGVARSIQEFGFRQPIVVDAENVIVCGHTRWKAAQKLGLKEVPVHVARELTPEQVRAYRIADNKLQDLAVWDMELLPIELKEIQDLGVDLSLIGFPEEELARLLEGEMTPGLTDPDDVPEPPDEAVTKPGDLWQLGQPPPPVRRLRQRERRGSAPGRRGDSPGQHRSAVQREGRASEQQRHRRWLIVVCRVWPRAACPWRRQGLPTTRDSIWRAARRKPMAPRRRCGRRTGRSRTISSRTRQFEEMLRAWFGNIARVLEPGRSLLHLGRLRQQRQLPAAS